ncbi:MAG: 16S rRNA (guanine(527)-N(7))-methyltransferase RsmG, partial [Lentimicrobiaceae bacterium]|nr:16S rRNA (guanine(527)-N(7))-methyltransferase RsmG [Lentimicrobiaceae bacterium]
MEQIKRYFPLLTETQLEAFEKLDTLYSTWNESINVISRKDIAHLYERHVLHSLGIAKIFTFDAGTRILDAGTGGGFPGIPLAIFFPEVKFHLVDATGKKIKVVYEIVRALGIKNVTAEHARLENVNDTFDFVVSRAVTALPEFVKLTAKNIQAGQRNGLNRGIIYLKGGDFKEELETSGCHYKIYPLSNWFKE